jgi:hypothetical protein
MNQINYIFHINAFFAKARNDKRLRANDMSLYLALFMEWNHQRFAEVFNIRRKDMMEASHIGSNHTYVQCLRQLHDCGYIVYRRPADAYSLSKVSIREFTGAKTASHGNFAGVQIDPHIWPGIAPHMSAQNAPQQGAKVHHLYKHNINNNKTEKTGHSQKKISVSLQEVLYYFQAAGAPPAEARKFFNHYEAVNWQLGHQPISNWQAAADKWFENVKTFKNTPHDKHGTVPQKDYTKQL